MDAAVRSPRLTAMLTVLTGLAALAVTVVFNFLPQVSAAGACLPADAMVHFEFARSAADAPFLTGDCQAKSIMALDAINRLDLRGYIPSYCSFAAIASIFLGRRARSWLVAAAIAAVAVTAVADVVETTTLMKITADLDSAGPLYATSSTAAWIKFGALALNSAVLALIAWRAQPRRPIMGVLLCLPPLATIAVAISHALTGFLTLSYLIGWTPVLLIAMRDAAWVAPAREPAPAA